MKKRSLIISLILLLGIVVAYERKQVGDEWDRGFHRLSLDYEDGGIVKQLPLNANLTCSAEVNNNQNQENIQPFSPKEPDVSKPVSQPQPALDLFSE
jgi:hypothetical protein